VNIPYEVELSAAAALAPGEALARLGADGAGLSSVEAAKRLAVCGPNVLRSHGVSWVVVLVRQLRSYLLLLLSVAAVVSAVVGDGTEALIIGVIIALSVGLSFLNEFRSEKAVEALHAQIRHLATADRDGRSSEVDVTELVPGDVVHLRVGDVVQGVWRVAERGSLDLPAPGFDFRDLAPDRRREGARSSARRSAHPAARDARCDCRAR